MKIARNRSGHFKFAVFNFHFSMLLFTFHPPGSLDPVATAPGTDTIQRRHQAGALQNLAALRSVMYHRGNRKKNANEDSHRQRSRRF